MKPVVSLSLVLIMISIPLFLKDPRWLHIIITIGIYIILAGGLRLIMSTGQVSFAHAGFWSIGAYTSALLVMKAGLSFWIALFLSGMAGGIVSILIGYPCLRLKGPYFFMITLAFGEILRMLYTSWVGLFGGANGIADIPYPDPIRIGSFVIEFSSRSVHYYYLMVCLLLASLFIFYRLERSRFSMACSAIREHDSLAESLGVDIMRYKVVAFLVACFLASLSGSFHAHYMTYISPGSFTFNESILFQIMVLIGGAESTSGVIIGAILITLIGEFAREAARFEPIVYGGALVVILLFCPGGLLGLFKLLFGGLSLSRGQSG